MKKIYQICLLALLVPACVYAQVSFTLTSSSFDLIKSKSKARTTLHIELISKTNGKWVATDGTVQYVPKPQQTIPLKGSLLLPGSKDLPQAVNPERIKIYSVPTAPNLQVGVDLASPTFSIAVYDLIGKPLFKGNYKNIKDKNIFIPTDQLASGRYFLKVEWAGKTEIKSFSVL